MQVPSAVSAIKVDGRRAYARVREGEDVELAARPVTVARVRGTGATRRPDDGLPVVDLDVAVICSSGTYIRALARDLGAGLGVGGHLTALRRTRVGPYGLDVGAHPRAARRALQPCCRSRRRRRAAFPARELTAEEAWRLAHGQRLAALGRAGEPVAAFAPDGSLVAMVAEDGVTARPSSS